MKAGTATRLSGRLASEDSPKRLDPVRAQAACSGSEQLLRSRTGRPGCRRPAEYWFQLQLLKEDHREHDRTGSHDSTGSPGTGNLADRSAAAGSECSGREVIQNRVEISDEAPLIRHKHPGEEIIYVLEGSLEYQIDGLPARKYNAGEALVVPAETVHAVRNVGEGNGAEFATFVIEKGKPFVVLADD